jgi:hypothetical protein
MLATRESTAATVPYGHPGVIARLVDVVVDPRAAFRSIAVRPAWIGTLFVVAAMRFTSMFAFYRPDSTAGKLVAGVAFQLATLVPVMVASSGLLWFASRLWAIRLGWSVAFSIVVHVYAAHTIATILVASVAGAMLPASVEVDLNSPPFTDVTALVDVSSFPILERLLGELDVRSVYGCSLVALGVAAADPAASRTRIAGVVASCFAVRVAGVAWAALQ